MHPAYSIIFFTTASGAGYGLMAWLAFFGARGQVPADPWLGGVGLFIAAALVTAGLLSSTFHLGRPERAWRAFSQWRSSWLSREGVLSLATFAPALVLTWGWVMEGRADGPYAVAAAATVVLAVATVFCTAMIYASLKPIRAWNNPWVPPNYLILSAMTGALLLQALLAVFGADFQTAGLVTLAAIFVAWCLKSGYWKFIDRPAPGPTPETATGLGHLGKVRLLEPPNTSPNFVQKEMGYAIARKHAMRLRPVAIALAFALPFGLTVAALLIPGTVGTVAAIAAVPVMAMGVIVERWLFFAEARHASMLYYGAEAA